MGIGIEYGNAGTTYNIKNNQAASKNLSIYNHTIIGKTIRKIFNVYTNMHTRVKNKMEQVWVYQS